MRAWRYLLALPSIIRITGVRWTRKCDLCNISKAVESNTTQEPCNNCSKVAMSCTKGNNAVIGDMCWTAYAIDRIWDVEWYVSPSWFMEPGFTLQCLCDPRDFITIPQDKIHPLVLLYRRIQRLLVSLYPLGSAAMVLNSVVIAVIATSKTLRKSPILFLILNLAVCDLLMGLYCILTATFNRFLDSDEEVRTYNDKLHEWRFHHFSRSSFSWPYKNRIPMCPYMIFIFSVTQFSAVMTSLFLTVEKYLAIVYCMKPDVRLTKKIAVACVCVTWCVAIAYNVSAVFFLGEEEQNLYSLNNLICATSGHTIDVGSWDGEEEFSMPFPVFLSGCYILIFLCTVPLYVHMYLVVRKSSTQAGVKREGSLARKLALVMLTNLIFSVIPLSLAPILGDRHLAKLQLFDGVFTKSGRSYESYLICAVLVPVLLLCLNSCLNPFLFAFRHHGFKSRFRQIVCKALECLRKKQKSTADQQRTGRRCLNRVEHR